MGGSRTELMRRSLTIAVLCVLATPASGEFQIPCLWKPFGGCTVTFVSPEYAAKPLQPLDPQTALAEINVYRVKNGPRRWYSMSGCRARPPSNHRIRRSETSGGHYGTDGSKPMDRVARAGYHAKIASENVAAGQKSFSDVMHFWEGSPGHRENLLRPNVTAIGVAMAKTEAARAYWTSRPWRRMIDG